MKDLKKLFIEISKLNDLKNELKNNKTLSNKEIWRLKMILYNIVKFSLEYKVYDECESEKQKS